MMNSFFLNAMTDRQIDARAGGRTSAWVSGYGGSNLVDGNDTIGSHKFKEHVAGLVLGLDRTFSPALSLGGAFSFGSSNFHLDSANGTGSADTIEAGLYGTVKTGRVLYGDFQLALASDTMTTQRSVTVGSATDQLTGHARTITLAGRYEEGVDLDWVIPYAALDDTLVRTPDYTETASTGSSNLCSALRGTVLQLCQS